MLFSNQALDGSTKELQLLGLSTWNQNKVAMNEERNIENLSLEHGFQFGAGLQTKGQGYVIDEETERGWTVQKLGSLKNTISSTVVDLKKLLTPFKQPQVGFLNTN